MQDRPLGSLLPRVGLYMGFLQLVLAVAFAMPSRANEVTETQTGFDVATRGYIRTGTTLYNSNTPAYCFKAPAAFSKYRLGNECDTFLDLSLNASYQTKDLEFEAVYAGDFFSQEDERLKYVGSDGAYLSIRNKQNNLSGWMGRRLYRREEVHITDFIYMHILGDGFGIENLALKDYQLSLAYLKRKNKLSYEGQYLQQQLFHGSLQQAPPSGNNDSHSKVDFYYSKIGQFVDGFGVYWQWQQPQPGGGNHRVVLQYGQNLAGLFDAFVYPDELSQETLQRIQDSKAVRLMDEYLVLDNHEHAWVLLALYQRQHWKEAEQSHYTDWFSVGTRYKRYWSDKLNWVVEVGLDNVHDNQADISGTLYKATLALQLTKKRGFYVRPALRTFITWSRWTKGINPYIGDIDNPLSQEGFRIGLQLEHWW